MTRRQRFQFGTGYTKSLLTFSFLWSDSPCYVIFPLRCEGILQEAEVWQHRTQLEVDRLKENSLNALVLAEKDKICPTTHWSNSFRRNFQYSRHLVSSLYFFATLPDRRRLLWLYWRSTSWRRLRQNREYLKDFCGNKLSPRLKWRLTLLPQSWWVLYCVSEQSPFKAVCVILAKVLKKFSSALLFISLGQHRMRCDNEWKLASWAPLRVRHALSSRGLVNLREHVSAKVAKPQPVPGIEKIRSLASRPRVAQVSDNRSLVEIQIRHLLKFRFGDWSRRLKWFSLRASTCSTWKVFGSVLTRVTGFPKLGQSEVHSRLCVLSSIGTSVLMISSLRTQIQNENAIIELTRRVAQTSFCHIFFFFALEALNSKFFYHFRLTLRYQSSKISQRDQNSASVGQKNVGGATNHKKAPIASQKRVKTGSLKCAQLLSPKESFHFEYNSCEHVSPFYFVLD